MTDPKDPTPITIERSIEIERDPDACWSAVRALEGLLVAPGVFDGVTTERHDDGRIEQHVRLGEGVHFRARLESLDDERRVVRGRMVEGVGVPWTDYRSTVTVEAAGETASRIVVRLDCVPLPDTGDTVAAMLRDSLDLGLAEAKRRIEAADD